MLLLANARCLKKRRKQKHQICFEWRIFSKTTTNSEKKMFSKLMKKEKNEENNIRLLYTTLG